MQLPSEHGLRAAACALELAMLTEKRTAVEGAAADLCNAITRAIGAPPVRVSVLAKRPRQADGELHGLYTLSKDGRARIQIWMRTAAHKKVVAFRTFLRTLLHEVCHHLDYATFGLPESFHTEGFFRRESSLFRQVAPTTRASHSAKRTTNAPRTTAARTPAPPRVPAPKRRSPEQLSLFD